MKKIILIIAALLFVQMNGFAQITFEKGYYISTDGERVECFIRNADWNSNPEKFDYRLTEDSEFETKEVGEVQEFGIGSNLRYVSANVNIDRSSEDAEEMSRERQPDFNEESLFLRVLVSGEATLYQYRDNRLVRFFFKIGTSDIDQLVYKKFMYSKNKYAENEYFQQQLFNEVNCREQSVSQISSLRYNAKDLVGYFKSENTCRDADFTDYQEQDKTSKGLNMTLALRPGVNFSNLEIMQSGVVDRTTDFGNSVSFRIGLESEFILPFNKMKWSIIFEPLYESLKTENYEPGRTPPTTEVRSEVDYKALGLPLGIRYYSFLNERFSIFYNAGFQYSYTFDSSYTVTSGNGGSSGFDLKAGPNLFLGTGFKFDKRYGAELRYNLKKDLTQDRTSLSTRYHSLALVLSYNLF